MMTTVIPKLPMINKENTRQFYLNFLECTDIGTEDFNGYLIVKKENIEIHFFEFKNLEKKENYGQIYIRVNNIEVLYKSIIANNGPIHPSGALQLKPWGQKEFSLLDPNYNLITFGESV